MELFSRGAVGEVNQLIGNLAQADRPLPRGLPPTVVDYFKKTAALPNWADQSRIAVAQQVFARHGWEVSLGLFCSSLPQGYAAGSCAQVHGPNPSVIDNASRRIFETAQFLFDVLDEGGLSPSGRGIRACQKVRLMHGACAGFLAAKAKSNATAIRLIRRTCSVLCCYSRSPRSTLCESWKFN